MNRLTRSLYIFTLTLLIMGLGIPLWSYPNNYQQILVGARSAGMGGAGTAIIGDGEVMYYNPAGIVGTQFDGISISVNNYGLYYMYESNRQKAGDSINPELKHTSGVLIIPTATTMSFILDKSSPDPKHFLSIGMFVPSRVDLEAESTATDGSYIHHVKNWMFNYIYQFSVNYATKLNRFLAFGFAVVVTYSKLYRSDVFFHQDLGTPANSTMANESYNFKTVALGFSTGVVLTFDRVKIGFTLKSKQLRVYSESNYSYVVYGDNPEVYWGLKVNYQRPWELYFGVMVDIIKDRLMFALDFKLYPGERQVVVDAPGLRVEFERANAWNINAGIEWYITKVWTFRCGFFTDRSGTPKFEEDSFKDINNVRTNRYGIVFGAGITGKNTVFNFSFTFIWGKGHQKIKNILDFTQYGITDLKMREFVITIGTSYWFDSPKKQSPAQANPAPAASVTPAQQR